jgi:hypothetical protein
MSPSNARGAKSKGSPHVLLASALEYEESKEEIEGDNVSYSTLSFFRHCLMLDETRRMRSLSSIANTEASNSYETEDDSCTTISPEMKTSSMGGPVTSNEIALAVNLYDVSPPTIEVGPPKVRSSAGHPHGANTTLPSRAKSSFVLPLGTALSRTPPEGPIALSGTTPSSRLNYPQS